MIYRCRQCGEVLGIDSCYKSQFCNEICEGEYARFIETGTKVRTIKESIRQAFGLSSPSPEKIDSRFEILDL